MAHDNAPSYDKTTDKTIDICLNCKKIKCSGECNLIKKPKKRLNKK